MAILDKIEKWGTIGIVGVVAYVLWRNWDNIKGTICNLPLFASAFPHQCGTGGGGGGIHCTLTMQDCWNQKGATSQVDLVNCRCTEPTTPITHECSIVGQIQCLQGQTPQKCIETAAGNRWWTDLFANCDEAGLRCYCGGKAGTFDLDSRAVQYYQQFNMQNPCTQACIDREAAGGGGGLNRCDCPNGGITFPLPGQSCTDACKMIPLTEFDKCYREMCSTQPGLMAGNCWSLAIYGTAWHTVGDTSGQCVNSAVVNCRARCGDPYQWEVWHG